MSMRNKHFEIAWRKGYAAAHNGAKKSDCPYKDHRTKRGGVTFSRAYRNAWMEGFKHGLTDKD